MCLSGCHTRPLYLLKQKSVVPTSISHYMYQSVVTLGLTRALFRVTHSQNVRNDTMFHVNVRIGSQYYCTALLEKLVVQDSHLQNARVGGAYTTGPSDPAR